MAIDQKTEVKEQNSGTNQDGKAHKPSGTVVEQSKKVTTQSPKATVSSKKCTTTTPNGTRKVVKTKSCGPQSCKVVAKTCGPCTPSKAIEKQINEVKSAVCACTKGDLKCPKPSKNASAKNKKFGQRMAKTINEFNTDLNSIMEDCVTRIQSWREKD